MIETSFRDCRFVGRGEVTEKWETACPEFTEQCAMTGIG